MFEDFSLCKCLMRFVKYLKLNGFCRNYVAQVFLHSGRRMGLFMELQFCLAEPETLNPTQKRRRGREE